MENITHNMVSRSPDPQSPSAPVGQTSGGPQPTRPNRFLRLGAWALAALAFCLAYGQSPLFSSNQNQYFLHGAARAGIGFLARDWLANTADPTPLFSWLVEWTFRLLSPAAFHLESLLLFGVYLAGLWLLADSAFGLRTFGRRTILFVVIVVVLHSAGLRLLQGRLLDETWQYLWDGGVAGQRLLGPVLQPSTFGVFLLLSVGLFVRGKPAWSVVAAALAAAVHPTYLLPAGILVLAYCMVLWREKRSLQHPLLLGVFALALVTPVVLYVILALGPTSPDLMAHAQQIFVHVRVPHHALPGVWFDATVVVKLTLLALAIVAARGTRLTWVLAFATAAGLALTAAQIVTGSDLLALLFPWRISAVLVPASVGVLSAWIACRSAIGANAGGAKWETLVPIASVAIIGLLAAAGVAGFVLQQGERSVDPAADMMRFVREQARPGDTYLIPAGLQEFRLATGAPALVDFKSIPYLDVDVLEWSERLRLVDRFYRERPANVNCGLLDEVAGQYGVTHVVLDADLLDLTCPQSREVYRDARYAVHVLAPP